MWTLDMDPDLDQIHVGGGVCSVSALVELYYAVLYGCAFMLTVSIITAGDR